MAARESRPLCFLMKVRRLSSEGSSDAQLETGCYNTNGDIVPSILLLASSTTVNLIPRSLVVFFRAATSALRSASLLRSSSAFSRSCSESGGSKGDRGCIMDVSNNRRNNTNTLGTSAVCFRIHIGAIKPSGYKGDECVKGESGEWVDTYAVSSGGTSLRGGNLTSLPTRII